MPFLLAILTAYSPFILLAAVLLVTFTVESAGWLLSFGTLMLIVGAVFTLKLTTLAALLAFLPVLGVSFVLYVVVGILYVRFYKWGSFIRSIKDVVDELKEQNPTAPLSKIYDLASARFRHRFLIPLRIGEHKGRIMRWMGYWPVSVLRTLIDDPLRRLYNHIYRSLAASMQAIADKAFPAAPPTINQ